MSSNRIARLNLFFTIHFRKSPPGVSVVVEGAPQHLEGTWDDDKPIYFETVSYEKKVLGEGRELGIIIHF
jgi:hypothetical protein